MWYSMRTSSPSRVPVLFSATRTVISSLPIEAAVTTVVAGGRRLSAHDRANVVKDKPWPNSNSGVGPVQYLIAIF